MDRAAWWVMDHGLAELDMPEQLTHTHTPTWSLESRAIKAFPGCVPTYLPGRISTWSGFEYGKGAASYFFFSLLQTHM